MRAIAESEGAVALDAERDPTARSRLWQARHDVAYAVQHSVPGSKHKYTDVCVPVSELAEAVTVARAGVSELGLRASIVGHAGDGNFHVGISVDPDDPTEVEAAEELGRRLVADALARGGTCSGEHGIGLGKIDALEQEHADLLPLYRAIKTLLRPERDHEPRQDRTYVDASHGWRLFDRNGRLGVSRKSRGRHPPAVLVEAPR